jgi:iron complex transport system substrate-binding protein
MRAYALLLASSLAIAPPAAEARPARVASLNLCTDELLLAFADDDQIASVTHLSKQSAETPYWQKANRFRTNDGSLLSVVAQKPDVVLTMGGGVRDRASIARSLQIHVLDLPYPQSLADIEASISSAALVLGQQARGRQVLGQLRRLERDAPATAIDTIWLGGGGRTVPASGLAAQWMHLAGLRQRASNGDRVSLEQLLVAPPRVLLRSDYRAGEYSGQQRWLTHPLARHARAGKTLSTDGRRWTCMGPSLIPEILRLRRELAR